MPGPTGATVGFVEAANILAANKQFIQDEITSWLSNEYSFNYDEVKCSRDVGLIVNAVLNDIIFGTNYLSRTAGLSYIRSYASVVTSLQREQTIAGINRAKELCISLITDEDTKDLIIANFKIVTDIIIALDDSLTPPLVFTDPNSVDSGIIQGAKVLQANREFLQAEVVAWINEQITIGSGIWAGFTYNQNTFYKDLGYIVDAVSFDLFYEGNSQSKHAGEAYYDDGVSTIPGQESQTAAAFNYLKSIVDEVIQNTVVTKTTGNTSTQNTSLPAGSATAASAAQSLVDIIVDLVTDGNTITATIEPTYSYGALYAFKNEDRETILANLSSIQTTVIEFLNEKYSANFVYNEATCRRDIGYIIEALRYDLTYGGNSQTRDAANSYAEGSVIIGEIEETQAAYEYWRTIVIDIVKNVAIVPSPGNTTPQDISIPTGSPDDPNAPAAKISTLLKIVIDVIDHGPGYIPEIPTDPDYAAYGDADLLVERATVLESLSSIQTDTINYLNNNYGGSITVTVFPPVQSAVNGVDARFHNVSTLSSGGTALEYVGAGVTYNALPFFGGEPIPENERIEINNGKAFTVTSDQVGNYRVGEFFTVNALTGEVTINAENLNLAGLASIGPFKRNGIPVGVQLREVSDNTALIASTGFQDSNTVPTQRAVSLYVENRYLNKVQSDTPQTVESDIAFIKDVEIRGGDLTTNQSTFNLVNTTATTVNFAGAATDVQIGSATGTTEINNNLNVVGDISVNGGDLTSSTTTFNLVNTTATTVNFAGAATDIQIGAATGTTEINNNLNVVGDISVDGGDLTVSTSTFNLVNTTATTVNFAGAATLLNLGASTGVTSVENALEVTLNSTLGSTLDQVTTINGSLVTNLKDNISTILDIKESSSSYIKIDTVNSFEQVVFGTTPKVVILNTTDSTTKDTGALVVEGGVGVEKNVTVGTNLKVLGLTELGNDRNADTLTVAGITNFDTPDNQGNVFEIRENLSSYLKVSTTDDSEAVTFGTTPKVRILNITDSTDKDTGALIVEGGAGIERNLTVGIDLTVNRDGKIDRDLAVNGTTLSTTSTTFNLVNANATTVNFAGAATDVQIGSNTGTTNVNNNLDVDGDVNIDGGDLTVSTGVFNLANTIVETINFAGAATDIQIGAATGTTNVNNNLVVDLDLQIKGGDLTTDQSTFNLLNTTATTVNFAGAATTVEIGASTGTTTVNNDLTVDGDLHVKGGDLTTDQTAFNLLSSGTQSVNAFTTATSIEIGSTTGTTSINNDLTVDGNTTLGNGSNDLTTINGSLAFNLVDNQTAVFDLKESTNSYFKLDTTNSFELITFGSLPKVSFLNLTDATNSTTAGTTFAGGISVAKKLWVGTNLLVDGSSTLGDNKASDTTVINGTVSVDLPDNTGTAFEIKENLSSYFKVVTTDLSESIEFGAEPKVVILNTTDSSTKDSGALVVEGGVGVEYSITTGLDVNVGRNAIVSNDLEVNGGDLTTTASTFNLLNANATAINFAGAATTVNIGAATGTTTVKNNLVVDLDLEVKGGGLTTNQSTFNLLNATATTLNIGGAGTTVNVGAATGTTTVKNNLVVDLDLTVKGGDLTTDQTTFNLLNATATTVNFGGAATDIQIGATTGITNVNNNLDVDGDVNIDGGDLTTSQSSFNLLNVTATSINAFGAASTIVIGSDTSTVTFSGDTASTTSSSGAVVVAGGVGIGENLNVGGNIGTSGNLTVTGDITANEFNSSKTTLQAPTVGNYDGERVRLFDFANIAKTNYAIGVEENHIWMGVDSNLNSQGFKWYGNTTEVMKLGAAGNLTLVGNAEVGGDLTVKGGDLTTDQTTFNLLNATATTVNFAGAATAIEIGAATGTTNVNNTLYVDGDFRLGSSVVFYNQGSNGFSVRDDFDIANSSTQTGYTFSSGSGKTSTILALGVTGEFNNFIGVTGSSSANKLVFGSTDVNTTFEFRNNSGTEPVNLNNGGLLLSVGPTGNVSITGDLEVKGGDLTTNQTTFNLVNATATTVNFAGAATTIQIGAASGTTTVNNNLTVDLDLAVNGGDLTTDQTTFNLINATATTVNFAGAATDIIIGATTGSTTIRNTIVVLDGDLQVKGGDLTTDQTTFNLLNATATTVNFAGAATDIQIGAATGTTNVNNNLVVDLDLQVKGGDLTTDQSIFNLLNTTATTINLGGDATTIEIGASTGTTNVNNNLVVDGDLQVKGGDLTTNQTTFNLVNATATTVNFAGAADVIVIGSGNSNTTFNKDITVLGNLTVSGTTTTINVEEILLADNVITLNSNYVGTTPTENSGLEINRGDLADAKLIWDELNDRWTLDNATGTLYIIHHTGRDVALGTETSGNYVATIAGTTNQITVANSGTETAAVVLSLPQDIHSGASPQFVNTTLTGDLAVNGGDITTTSTTFALVNANATTVNFAGAATAINIGAATGTVTINNTATVFNSTSHVVLPVGTTAQRPDPAVVGAVRYNTELQTFEGYTSAWGSLGGVKDVNGDTYIIPELSPGSNEDTLYFYTNGVNTARLTQTSLSVLHNTSSTTTTSGSLIVTGGVGVSENVNIGGTLKATGATTLSSTLAVTNDTTLTGDLAVNGGDLTTTAATFNLLNANATTVNIAGSATTVEIGSSSGTTNVNNNLVVDLDVEIKGGDLNTNQTTFNLLPTTVTTGNLFDVATSVNVSKSAAAASTMTVGPATTGNKLVINGTTSGAIDIDSVVTTGIVNLFASITTGTVNIATTNGSTINIGGAGSTTNVATLALTTDLEVQYGGTGQSTFEANGVVYGNDANGLLVTAASDPGVSNATTSYGILTTDVNNVPVWTDTIDEGEY